MWIYKITNNINNKIYIGLTTSKYASSRWGSHLYNARKEIKDYPITNAIRKYGPENFKFETIYFTEYLEDLNEKEIYFISLYKCTNPDFGYNILAGGKFSKHTDETKKKIGLKSIGRQTFLNKKHTKESKKLISERNKGKIVKQEQIDKVSKTYRMLNHENNIIEFKNLRKFCRDNNLDRRAMLRVLSGESKSYKRYRNINSPNTIFFGKDKEGNIHTFYSQSELKKYHIDTNKIGIILKKQRKSTNGWRFSYIKEDLINK